MILLAVTLALVWAWAGFVGMFDPSRTPSGYLALALTSLGSLAAYTLSRQHLRLAVTIYLLSLFAAIQIVVSVYADASLLSLYLLVVLVAAPLTKPCGLGVMTLLVLAAMVATGVQRGTQAAELIIPITLTVLTALTAWLSTRRLFTALGWALSMTDKAMRSTEEARDHRLELQRVLHSPRSGAVAAGAQQPRPGFCPGSRGEGLSFQVGICRQRQPRAAHAAQPYRRLQRDDDHGPGKLRRQAAA
jgi:hypothetical protein